MRVAVINTYNSKDINVWAGIPYHLSVLFEKIFEDIVYLKTDIQRDFMSYCRGFFYNRMAKKNYLSWADKKLHKKNYKRIQSQIKGKFDLIITYQFFLVPLLKEDSNHIIWWSDATFSNLLDFYPYTSNVCNYCISGGNSIQASALELCSRFILSSNWAITSAIKDYKANAAKAVEIPFAPNLSDTISEAQISSIVNNRKTDVINLLFIGINWERKGGNTIVALVNSLNNKGYTTYMHAVGTKVPQPYKENVNVIEVGFLNKKNNDDNAKLICLFKKCNYLTIASAADCSPIVFPEANSYALPVISSNVGGISSLIHNGKNGFIFNAEDFVEKATSEIIAHQKNKNAYEKLCFNSYEFYRCNFTWDIIENKFRSVIKNIEC